MIDTIKGFRDIDGKEAERRIAIRNIIEETFKKYNFIPAETPVIENEEFVKGNNSNDEAVSEIFKLQDRGERKLALRYEFTFQLKRLAMNKKLPYKRYQIGYVFRDEPTSEGKTRFRQFTQCDVDVVGSSIKDEAEVLSIAQIIFEKLGIKVSINVNNRKLLNEILDKEKITNKEEVIKEIDKLDKLKEEEVRQNLKKYKAEKVLDIFKNKEKDFEKYDNYKEIKELKEACELFGVEVNFVPFLARGLSYYNGSIFEIKSSNGEIKETISAGGSYLVNGMQATGISFGLDRLEMLAKIKEETNKVLVISIGQDKEAIKLVKSLRKNNIPCSIMYGKVTKALEYANSYTMNKVIFVGEEEIKKKKFLVKDMKTGKEEMISEKELIKKIF
jgi:histidyl-tRNA synthetase